MKPNSNLALALSAAVLLGAAATGRAAGPFLMNFDGAGSTAQAFAPSFMTIGYGEYVPSLDEGGDTILGSEHWQLDLTAGPVLVSDPNASGFGLAPSPSKALDARDGPVLLVFNSPYSFTSFSATLDNSPFGNLDPEMTAIKFYDAGHNLLFSAPADQTVSGFQVNVGALTGVTTVLLPSTAFYDNVQAVPEPGCLVSLLGGAALLLGCRRRRV